MNTNHPPVGNPQDDLREQILETRRSILNKVSAIAGDVTNTVEDGLTGVRLVSRCRHHISRSPWTSFGAAVGVGLIVGTLSRSRPTYYTHRHQDFTVGVPDQPRPTSMGNSAHVANDAVARGTPEGNAQGSLATHVQVSPPSANSPMREIRRAVTQTLATLVARRLEAFIMQKFESGTTENGSKKYEASILETAPPRRPSGRVDSVTFEDDVAGL